MNLNAVENRHGVTLHHEAILCSDPPQGYGGCREPVVDSGLGSDPRARTDIVQREIAERPNNLIAKSGRHDERAAVDHGSRKCRCELWGVAHSAADRGKEGLPCINVSVDWSAARR